MGSPWKQLLLQYYINYIYQIIRQLGLLSNPSNSYLITIINKPSYCLINLQTYNDTGWIPDEFIWYKLEECIKINSVFFIQLNQNLFIARLRAKFANRNTNTIFHEALFSGIRPYNSEMGYILLGLEILSSPQFRIWNITSVPHTIPCIPSYHFFIVTKPNRDPVSIFPEHLKHYKVRGRLVFVGSYELTATTTTAWLET
jgi:hypothetical protein